MLKRVLPLIFLLQFVWAQPASEEQIKTWVSNLGADHFKDRKTAEASLLKEGGRVRPYLLPLQNSKAPEISMRVQRILEKLGPDLFSFLVKKGTCKGEASEGNDRWPCIVTITEFNEESGEFTGTIEWTNLDALHEIKGKLDGEGFHFSETKFIRRGNAIIGVDYVFPKDKMKGSTLRGSWKSGTPRSGPAELHLP